MCLECEGVSILKNIRTSARVRCGMVMSRKNMQLNESTTRTLYVPCGVRDVLSNFVMSALTSIRGVCTIIN
jgi:hypothetical protein